MKPIKLKIKGLNSFIEEQVIDFDKLTSKGLFGIFGPTGSGKSTILDAITLALYGKLPRNSTNYINTNCSYLNVSYEFEISESKVKRYLVERKIKRDKHSGNPVSDKAKIIYISGNEIEVLEDKKMQVDKKCEEIIGLNIDDFTRTVVLPQGKFSEFLTLKGKDRRNMLERLFSLEKYGDELSRKLQKESAKENTKNAILTSNLKGYEDVSEDILKEKSLELSTIKDKEYNLNKTLEDVKVLFKESEDLWNNQKELQDLVCEENALKSKEEDMKNNDLKVSLAEKAENVIPNINNYESALIDIKELERAKTELEKEFKDLQDKKDSIDKSFEDIKLKKEEELPNLKTEKGKFEDAIEEKKQIDKLNDEILKYKEKLSSLKTLENEKQTKIEENENRVKNGKEQINEKELELEKTKVDEELRKKIIEGTKITEQIKTINENIKKIDKKKKEIEGEISENKKDKKLKSLSLETQNNSLREKEEELKKLNQDFIYDKDDLLNIKLKINDYENKLKDANKIKKNTQDYEKDMANIKELIKEDTKNKEILEEEINNIKDQIKLLEIENISKEIRKNLKDGGICPICGSTHHELDNIKAYDGNSNALENQKNLIEKEGAFNNLNSRILSNNSNLNFYKDKVKDNIELLEKDYKDISENSLKELNKEYKSMEEQFKSYEESKKNIESQIESLKEDINKLFIDVKQKTFLIEEGEKMFKEENENLEKEVESLKVIIEKFTSLKEDTGIYDFLIEEKKIDEKIKLSQQIEGHLKKYNKKLNELKSERDESKKELNNIEKEIASLESTLKEKEANKIQKETLLKKKVNFFGNLDEKLKDINLEIKNIEQSFKREEKIKQQTDTSYLEYDKNLQKNLTRLEEVQKNCSICFDIVKELLKKYNFKNIEEAKNNQVDCEVLIKLKEEVEKYKSEKLKIKGAIDNIKSKIGGKSILEEDWLKIKSDKESLETDIKNIFEDKVKKEKELEIINDKLSKVQDLLKDKEKVDKKLGLLNDLDKLFKGKKFIEFVALNQLKYISLEASKRLQEITRGMYSLEVDNNGQFMIRDYKNGGALRDASTLSGGEVFLVSFSLALSLSSQIQLKGSAPLELFFLDEGFGTLDENLLDIVMDSIEKIHNEKLKIGIISHVESIKDRVPMKLILTPAESGKGGSKVKIESN